MKSSIFNVESLHKELKETHNKIEKNRFETNETRDTYIEQSEIAAESLEGVQALDKEIEVLLEDGHEQFKDIAEGDFEEVSAEYDEEQVETEKVIDTAIEAAGIEAENAETMQAPEGHYRNTAAEIQKKFEESEEEYKDQEEIAEDTYEALDEDREHAKAAILEPHNS